MKALLIVILNDDTFKMIFWDHFQITEPKQPGRKLAQVLEQHEQPHSHSGVRFTIFDRIRVSTGARGQEVRLPQAGHHLHPACQAVPGESTALLERNPTHTSR